MPLPSRPTTDHRRRFRRLLAIVVAVAVVAVVAALAVLAAQGIALRVPLVIAMTAGIGGSVLLAGALMGLVFASASSGHDDAVVDPTNEQGRPEGRPWRR